MKKAILEMQQVTYHYPDGTKALDNVSIVIPNGAKIAILGSNGAGKSTLLLHLNGTLKPRSGSVFYKEGQVDYSKKTLNALRREVGIVFQDPDSQLFSASVYQDISFGPLNLDLDKETVKERVAEAMDQTEVSDFSNKPTHALSYGQKKRVSIAGILAMKPEVIILDEPTASLDPMHTSSFMKLLVQLNDSGTTLIMSTHNVEAAWDFAEYIYVMKDGALYAGGTPLEIFSNQTLLNETDLEKPMVLEILERLVASGIVSQKVMQEDAIPRSKEQLFMLLEQVKGATYEI